MLNRAGIITLLTVLSWSSGAVLAEPKKELTSAEKRKLEQTRSELIAKAQKLFGARDYDEGMASLEKVLAVEKKLFGAAHSNVIERLNNLADNYEALGQDDKAAKRLQQAAQILEQHFGKNHWQAQDAARAIEDLTLRRRMKPAERKELQQATGFSSQANRLYRAGRTRQAIQLLEHIVKLRERLLGEKHPQYAASLSNLALVHQNSGDDAKALALFLQARDILKAALGEKHPGYARALNNLALLYQKKGEMDKALPFYLQVCSISKATLGEKHPQHAIFLNNLAAVYKALGKTDKALELYLQGLEIFKASPGEKSPEYATALSNLGALYRALGQYAKAFAVLEQGRTIKKALLGEMHPDYARSLANLGGLSQDRGEYDKARDFYQQARDIYKAAHGEKHPDYASALNNLAALHKVRGELDNALALFQQARAILKVTLGEQHLNYARSLNNLGSLYQEKGEYAKAIQLYLQALSIKKIRQGEKHPDYALSLNSLAESYRALGDTDRARALYLQARDIYKASLGEKHPSYARALTHVATLEKSQGNDSEALPLLQQALAIRKAALGENHPDYALSLSALANLYQEKKGHAKARDLYLQALSIQKATLGDKHPDYAMSLCNLATLHAAMGNPTKALPLYLQSQEIFRAALGKHHPLYATFLSNLAAMLEDRGELAKAEKWYLEAANAFLSSRDLVSDEGLERASFTSQRSPLILLCSVLAHNKKPLAAWEWLEKSLGRSTWDELKIRQRLSQAEKAELQKLHGRIQNNQKLLQVFASKPKLSEEQQALQKQWLTEQGKLYAALSELQQKLREKYGASGGKSLTLKKIQSTLSPRTALLTWADAPSHHWVVIVRSQGDPLFVPAPGLGAKGAWSKEEMEYASELRKRLSRSAFESKEQIEALKKQRIDPVLKHLQGVDHLVVLPSPMMDGIPLELLVEEKTVSYAPSATIFTYLNNQKAAQGNNLLALGDPLFKKKLATPTLPEHGVLLTTVVPGSAAAKAGLMVNDVMQSYHKTTLKSLDDLKQAFNQPGLPETVRVKYWRQGKIRETVIRSGSLGVAIAKEPAPLVLARRHKDRELVARLRGGDWQELPGTRVELESLKQRFKNATIYTDSAASEQTLQRLEKNDDLSKFRYLHFATHGEMNQLNQMQSAIILSHDQLPDLSASVKLLEEGKDVPDGKLTAKEVLESWKLDADLVTISACESGLGKKEKGEGYMGFSQAFLLVGARSVVLSLWKVDDTATALLMDRFYENLLGQRKGIKPMTKAEALKEAKEWLRTLPRKEVLTRAAKISKGVARGKGNPDLPLLKEVPKVGAPEKDAPYAHPYYWAAFILIGNPK